jgi:hypothetical protein
MKLIILKIEANHHENIIEGSQRDISQNRNQSAREKFPKEKEIKRLLSKEVILQEKLLEAKGI